MIFLMGRMASGKDTILNQMKKYGYKKMITYTTRPMRPGEIQDSTYHFIDEAAFEVMRTRNEFLEYKSYDTVFGKWFYGSAVEDYKNADDHTVVIITPSGYKDFLDRIPEKDHFAIYISAHNDTLKKRIMLRGDNEDEAQRRMLQDDTDFKGIEKLADAIVYNDEPRSLRSAVTEVVFAADKHIRDKEALHEE